MPLNRRVSVQQAGMNALGTWLKAQPELVGVAVRHRWPTPGQPFPADGNITLLMAGEPEELWTQEELYSSSPVADSNQTDTVWTVKARRQNVQIDIWATDDMLRDHLVDVWDELSHKGPLFTLGTGDPVSDGLNLRLDPEDGHTGFVSFTFDAAGAADTPDARQQHEYRTMIRGYLDVRLQVRARTARIVRAILKQTVNGGAFPDHIVTEAS